MFCLFTHQAELAQKFKIAVASQIIGGDFAKFCGLLRINEL